MRPPDPVLVGSSESFRDFLDRMARVAKSDATVLISGESGSGKGLAARALHAASTRASGPFVSIHLAAVTPTLVEAELFGHERGAFTGADRERLGRIRRAHGGTLVLDDVGLLPQEAQVKLLRVLQERQIEPLGSEGPVDVDVRVVATSSEDLAAMTRDGRFREDLYYRLAVVPLMVPPLRARADDLPELVRHLVGRLEERLRVPARALSEGALERLARHPWPGNVRELENALERVMVLGSKGAGEVPPEELDFLDEATDGVARELAVTALAHGLSLEDLSRAVMDRALEEHRGNVSAAARQVGLTRRAFEYRSSRRDEDEDEEGEEET